MYTLDALLAALPAHDLRSVAIHLGVYHRWLTRKEDWHTAIVHGWQHHEQANGWLTTFSALAQQALWRLTLSPQLPLSLFTAEYGVLHRNYRGKRRAAIVPTATDELYYSGLLHRIQPPHPGAIAQVALPIDLRSLVVTFCQRQGLASSPSTEQVPLFMVDETTTLALVHDLAQLLIYLHQQHYQASPLTLQQERWLSPRHLAALNQRLLQPGVDPRPRSHKQCDRLRTLSFLAAAAGLVDAGVVTAVGWAWLAQPVAEQMRHLWTGWQAASPALRECYAMPDRQLPAPWPLPLVATLSGLGAQLTPPLITAALLQQATVSPLYWLAHFADLQALDTLAAALLQGPLQQLGLVCVRPSVVDPSAGSAAGERVPATTEAHSPADVSDRTSAAVFGLTAWGAHLLHHAAPPATPPPSPAQLTLGPAQWVVQVPVHCLAAEAQAVLAGYADPATGTHVTTGGHCYHLDAKSVAQAAASGLGLPPLVDALARLGIPLPATSYPQLTDWWQQGRDVQVGLYPLLRTTKPAILTALTQEPTVRPLIGEVLTPTSALLQGTLAAVTQALRAVGRPVLWPVPTVAGSDPAETAAGQAVAETPAPGPFLAGQGVLVEPGQSSALWLAGQLYRLLGEHLALPLPPPMPALSALYAQLPAAEQALLQAQLADVQDRLLALLDHLAFTPPPSPSDPTQWRPRIDQAIAQKQRLDLHYFSAGRNLLTRRLVDPHRVDKQYGALYLIAYCHEAGRILTFRLDRIMDLVAHPNAESRRDEG